jgi:hypothetical protein
MPDTRQGYRPCSVCNRFASEWRVVDGTRYAVTAPRGVSVSEGEPWTCTLCVEHGHEQKATKSTDLEQTLV